MFFEWRMRNFFTHVAFESLDTGFLIRSVVTEFEFIISSSDIITYTLWFKSERGNTEFLYNNIDTSSAVGLATSMIDIYDSRIWYFLFRF